MRLLSLVLEGFKGVRYFALDAQGKDVTILGDNGTGKTTVYDAYTWLLFGRDSQNEATFEVKTLDAQGQSEPEALHRVTAVLEAQGGQQTITLSRSLIEKWSRKRGSATKELVGHETFYQIDGERLQKSAFDRRVAELVDERDFRLLSDPLYFNEGLAWKDRRALLMEIAGDVDDGALVTPEVASALAGRTYDVARAALDDESKRALKALNDLPVRIAEAKRGIQPGPSVEAAEAALAEVLAQGAAEAALGAFSTAQAAERAAESEWITGMSAARKLVMTATQEVARAQSEAQIAERHVLDLRRQYAGMAVNKVCPTCGQALESQEGIEERQRALIAQGKDAATVAESAQTVLKDAQAALKDAERALKDLEAQQELALANVHAATERARSAWQAAKPDARAEADARAALALAQTRTTAEARVRELMNSERELAAAYEAVQAKLMALAQYNQGRVRLVEDAVNGMFSLVRFQMFAEQLNGGLQEVCVATREGVPYTNLNTAGRIQVGLDIIRVLQAHYGLEAPVFIDGAESITNIPDLDCQVIKLRVSADHPELTLE